jgi:predicted amidohydrolase
MAKRDTLKIAAAQYPIDEPATLAAWQDKIARWVADGSATGAELLVFPEYAAIEQASCFGPAVYGDLKTTLEKVAELAGDRVALHAELAKKHGVHILVGSGPVKKSDGRFVNAAQLVTPGGQVGEQEKIIMTPFERDWGVAAGGPLRVFETALGKIGVAICYDSEFPLLARALAEAGVEVLLVPSSATPCSDGTKIPAAPTL